MPGTVVRTVVCYLGGLGWEDHLSPELEVTLSNISSPCLLKKTNSGPQLLVILSMPGMVAHAFIPSLEGRGSQISMSSGASLVYIVSSKQPRLHSESLSQKTNRKTLLQIVPGIWTKAMHVSPAMVGVLPRSCTESVLWHQQGFHLPTVSCQSFGWLLW